MAFKIYNVGGHRIQCVSVSGWKVRLNDGEMINTVWLHNHKGGNVYGAHIKSPSDALSGQGIVVTQHAKDAHAVGRKTRKAFDAVWVAKPIGNSRPVTSELGRSYFEQDVQLVTKLPVMPPPSLKG